MNVVAAMTALFALSLAARADATEAAREVSVLKLRATSGRLEAIAPGAWHIDGSVRATAEGGPVRMAEVTFIYEGPSTSDVPLASGERRRQIGLKLRSQDTCNVVYVMWHIEPAQRVAVSVKRNPGASTHAACGDRGYTNVSPRLSAQPRPVRPTGRHALRAELDGRELRVLADGAVAWEGTLPEASLEFDGGAGLRTDNGRFVVMMRTTPR
jgi:hypothetical protein